MKKRFKNGVKYLPAYMHFLQIFLLVIIIFSPKNQWWPLLIWNIILGCVILYFVYRQPYIDPRFNHYSRALLFNNFYTFFRSFLINLDNNPALNSIESFGIFLTPFILILGVVVSYIRSLQLKCDESDDYDEIEIKSDSNNKWNFKYANMIIDLMIEHKIKGVKIQAKRVKKVTKECTFSIEFLDR